MKIAIIADTHLKSALYQSKILSNIKKALEGFDFIFHAGDIANKEIYDELISFAPIIAVKGNNDDESLNFLPAVVNKEIEGKKIVMAHQIETIVDVKLDSADIVIYGHVHYPIIKEIKNKLGQPQLIINPGSLIAPRPPPARAYGFDAPISLPSMAILEISNGIVSAMIKRFYSNRKEASENNKVV